MAKFILIDHTTGAMHINGTALLQHKYGSLLTETLDRFYSDGPLTTLCWLRAMEPCHKRAIAVDWYLNILHEVRHYVDLLLTPFGFYRLRNAFECYRNLLPIVMAPEFGKLVVPLKSGLIPLNQKMWNLKGYEESLAGRYAQFLQRREEVISHDNDNFGFDYMLEALAYSLQTEIANLCFDEPFCHNYSPYLYNKLSISHGNEKEFNRKYRWHYPLAKELPCLSDDASIRFLHLTIFASMCGSIARNSNYKLFNSKSYDPIPSSGRYIDNFLPSYRFEKLFNALKQVKQSINNDWIDLYNLVSNSYKELFGCEIIDEINDDINSDKKLLNILNKNNKSNFDFSSIALKTLIDKRCSLFDYFKKNPAYILSPVQFVCNLSKDMLPDVIINFPHGIENYNNVDSKKWQIIYDNSVKCNEHSNSNSYEKEITRSRVYMFKRIYSPKNSTESDAWNIIYNSISPVYKILNSGLKNETMCEIDIAHPYLLKKLEGLIHWDPEYKNVGYNKSPDNYFHFYDLTMAKCDCCSCEVDKTNCRYISGLTIRQNKKFMKNYINKNKILALENVILDWSGWILCDQCINQYDF